jgi:microcystin-dependent protein
MCGTAGNGLPINIQNPLLGLNFIIATQGIFPSRN